MTKKGFEMRWSCGHTQHKEYYGENNEFADTDTMYVCAEKCHNFTKPTEVKVHCETCQRHDKPFMKFGAAWVHSKIRFNDKWLGRGAHSCWWHKFYFLWGIIPFTICFLVLVGGYFLEWSDDTIHWLYRTNGIAYCVYMLVLIPLVMTYHLWLFVPNKMLPAYYFAIWGLLFCCPVFWCHIIWGLYYLRLGFGQDGDRLWDKGVAYLSCRKKENEQPENQEGDIEAPPAEPADNADGNPPGLPANPEA